jgi:hypothetical protein
MKVSHLLVALFHGRALALIRIGEAGTLGPSGQPERSVGSSGQSPP